MRNEGRPEERPVDDEGEKFMTASPRAHLHLLAGRTREAVPNTRSPRRGRYHDTRRRRSAPACVRYSIVRSGVRRKRTGCEIGAHGAILKRTRGNGRSRGAKAHEEPASGSTPRYERQLATNGRSSSPLLEKFILPSGKIRSVASAM